MTFKHGFLSWSYIQTGSERSVSRFANNPDSAIVREFKHFRSCLCNFSFVHDTLSQVLYSSLACFNLLPRHRYPLHSISTFEQSPSTNRRNNSNLIARPNHSLLNLHILQINRHSNRSQYFLLLQLRMSQFKQFKQISNGQ